MNTDVRDLLVSHNIKPSYQRLLIYNHLNRPDQHLSVDQIYRELSPEVPTLSKTTVYNTLKLMCEKGIVREINTDHLESRYETATDPHGHFKCLSCGEIIDFPLVDVKMDLPELKGCKVKEIHTTLYGTCHRCIDD